MSYRCRPVGWLKRPLRAFVAEGGAAGGFGSRVTGALSRILGLLLLLAWVGAAWADGKVMGRMVATSVTTPDQRAMLHFSNGVERLVIETSLVGDGTDFAWLVPLPSEPRIEVVSKGFFRHLAASFEPNLVTRVSDHWVPLLAIGLVVFLVISCWRRKTPGDAMISTVAILLGAMLALAAVPNFVRARTTASSSVSSPSVRVLQRTTIGDYATATLASPDGRALIDWLNTNRFHVPATVLPVVSDYAAKGWVFVAARLNRTEAARKRSDLAPLAFTFRTERAVYPLRLTGVDNGPCSVELYVFGDQRAAARGFEVEYCGQPVEEQPSHEEVVWRHGVPREWFGQVNRGGYRFYNEEVRRLAFPAAVTTKLTGTLRPRDMQEDAWIRWQPVREVRPTLHTAEAALTESINWAAFAGVPGFLLVFLVAPRLTAKTAGRLAAAVLILVAAGGFGRLGTARLTVVSREPWISSLSSRWWGMLAVIEHYDQERVQERRPPPKSFDAFRQGLDDYAAESIRNIFTGRPLLHEPTPGNVALRPVPHGVEVYWYDFHAAPHRMITMTNF